MSPEDWVRLRDWFRNPNRYGANVAFTAGDARDAATAFESSGSLIVSPMDLDHLTKAEVDAFRRLPCSFDDMVRAIFAAGMVHERRRHVSHGE